MEFTFDRPRSHIILHRESELMEVVIGRKGMDVDESGKEKRGLGAAGSAAGALRCWINEEEERCSRTRDFEGLEKKGEGR